MLRSWVQTGWGQMMWGGGGLDKGKACDNATDSYEKHIGLLAITPYPKHTASQSKTSIIMDPRFVAYLCSSGKRARGNYLRVMTVVLPPGIAHS